MKKRVKKGSTKGVGEREWKESGRKGVEREWEKGNEKKSGRKEM